MTPYEWNIERQRLERVVTRAKRWVYPGQPEEMKAATYQILRDAEDALRRHLDSRTRLIKSDTVVPRRGGRWRVL